MHGLSCMHRFEKIEFINVRSNTYALTVTLGSIGTHLIHPLHEITTMQCAAHIKMVRNHALFSCCFCHCAL